MTSENSVSPRKVTYGLLFAAAVAIAMLFLNTGKAYAEASTQGTTTSGSGAAALMTGGATGSGNNSGTQASQGGSGSQGVKITNSGSGNANSGGNDVAGNSVDNDLDADQSDNGSAVNVQGAENNASGTASVTTGNAKASGNNASTSVSQKAYGNGAVNQSATVENIGHANANTGDNQAFGNIVDNDFSVDQSIDDDDAVVNGDVTYIPVNVQGAENNLDGTASITTGDAQASGNSSSTGIAQWAAAQNGSSGGVASVSQTASITNHGVADANTGENYAAGNDVINDFDADQGIEIRGPPFGGILDDLFGVDDLFTDDVDLSFTPINVQGAENNLDGSAAVTTGAASATGNTATNAISQEACASCEGGNASITQTAEVNNVGHADANSGNNDVVGNAIDNDFTVDQGLDFDLLFGDIDADLTSIPVNVQGAENNANGDAALVTGDASAAGNWANNSISQKAAAKGSDVNVVQNATVNNIGTAKANTGDNFVAGNAVANEFDADQGLLFDVLIGDIDADLTYVPINVQAAENNLDGSAALVTGDAAASGNVASTSISQEVCAEGTGFVGQHATVNNDGDADANTGRNEVLGNDLLNDLFADQSLNVDVLIGGVDLDVTRVAINLQGVENNLLGDAALVTGNAAATGSWSTTDVAQSANVEGTFNHDNSIEIGNAGDADANSGDNLVSGNDIVNDLFVDQGAELDSLFGDIDFIDGLLGGLGLDGLFGAELDLSGTAVNVQGVDNNVEGDADLVTGGADATGNVAHVSASSQIGPDIDWDACDCFGAKKHAKAEKKHYEVAHKARAARSAGGGELAFTGAPLAVLALLGLVLVALGGIARRKVQA